VAAIQWRSAHRDVEEPVVRFRVDLPPATIMGNVTQSNTAVSPDGRVIAYALVGADGAARIYVRPLDASDASVIAGTEGAQQPVFSPDGEWIAYIVRDELWKVARSGGAPLRIGPTDGVPTGMTWSVDGNIYVGAVSGLISIPASGGQGRVVLRPDTSRKELYINAPLALPDGDRILVSVQTQGGMSGNRLGVFSNRSGRLSYVDLPLLHPLALMDEDVLVYTDPNGPSDEAARREKRAVLNRPRMGASGWIASAGPVMFAAGADGLLGLQRARLGDRSVFEVRRSRPSSETVAETGFW
jgi:hypothetical protein